MILKLQKRGWIDAMKKMKERMESEDEDDEDDDDV